MTETNTREALTAAADEVRKLAVRMQPAQGAPPLVAKPENPWAAAIPDLLEKAGTETVLRGCGDCLQPTDVSSLGMRQTVYGVCSIQDHLYALSACLPHGSVLAVWSLSRVVLESASRMAWLNMGGTDPAETLLRCLGIVSEERKKQINLTRQAKNDIAGHQPTDERFLQACDDAIEHLEQIEACLSQVADKVSEISDFPKPSHEALRHNRIVKAVLDVIDRELNGRIIFPVATAYGLLSNAIHGDPHLIVGLRNSGAPSGQWKTPVHLAVTAATSALKTVDRWWESQIDADGIDSHINALK